MKQHHLEVLGILLTHGHIDHIGAIDAFDVPIYLHEKEVEIIKDNHKNGFTYYGKEKPYLLEDLHLIPINENHRFPLGDQEITVLYTPGHTIGSVCYRMGNDVYSGDTLFQGTVGKWTFPTGNLATLKHTILQLLDTLEPDLQVYPAHGPSTTIAQERKTNYFYHEWKHEK